MKIKSYLIIIFVLCASMGFSQAMQEQFDPSAARVDLSNVKVENIINVIETASSTPWQTTNKLGEEKLSTPIYKNGNNISALGDSIWKGSVKLLSGKIFFAPYNSSSFAIYDQSTDTIATYATAYGSGAFSNAITESNGKVICSPYNNGNIGIYNPVTNTMTNGPWIDSDKATSNLIEVSSGTIMFIPENKGYLYFYDIVTNNITNTSAFGLDDPLYMDAVKAPDGKIYLAPGKYDEIGIYDPFTKIFTEGKEMNLGNHWGNTFCGIDNGSGTNLILTGAQFSNIYSYNYITDTTTLIKETSEGDYAFSNTLQLSDGRILLIPSACAYFGIYDPSTNTYTRGPAHGCGTDAFFGATEVSPGKVLLTPYNSDYIGMLTLSNITCFERKVMDTWNGGHGSKFDADKLDSHESDYFAPVASLSDYLKLTGNAEFPHTLDVATLTIGGSDVIGNIQSALNEILGN